MEFKSRFQMQKNLQASQKPIIFHNGMYDILFLYHNLEATLPDHLQGFKEEFRKRIKNKIYDTKIPSDSSMTLKYRDQIPFSSLEEMTKFVKSAYEKQLVVSEVLNVQNVLDDVIAGKVPGVVKPANVELKALKPGEGGNAIIVGAASSTSRDEGGLMSSSGTAGEPNNIKSTIEAKFHDAGYDALQTGRLFAALRECEKVLDYLIWLRLDILKNIGVRSLHYGRRCHPTPRAIFFIRQVAANIKMAPCLYTSTWSVHNLFVFE